jgi:anti-sigma B factor antagonist
VREGGHPAIAVNRELGGVAVIALSGEHDNFSSPRLAKALAAQLAAGNDVVVDLSETTFIDSTTAGTLIAAKENAESSGARLVVLLNDAAGWAVRRLFETARLGAILTVASTLEDAFELTRAGRPDERRSGRATG